MCAGTFEIFALTGSEYLTLEQSGRFQRLVDHRFDVSERRQSLLLQYWLVILVEYFTLEHQLRLSVLTRLRRNFQQVFLGGGISLCLDASTRNPEKLCNVIK